MSDVETVKSAKKRHRCSWCAEGIDAGETYKRYRWFGDDGPATVKMHPECYDAMIELSQEWGDDIEFREGDNPRGCNCGHSRACDRCEAGKARAVERAHGIKTSHNLCLSCGHSIDAHDRQYGCAEDGCDCETPNVEFRGTAKRSFDGSPGTQG